MKARQFNKITATIEVRMTSSRLPGKHMLEVCGVPILGHLINRLKMVESISEIVVATTINHTDDVLCELASAYGVQFYRGSESDVMQRVCDAAKSVNADLIVEITGDCPLIDPEIVEQAIRLHCNNNVDYTGNAEVRSYPDGMDVQIFSVDDLAKAITMTNDSDDHEHVSLYFRRHPDIYQHLNLVAPPTLYWPELGLTLDDPRDFALIKQIFEYFFAQGARFSCADILSYLRENPRLVEINKEVNRNQVPI